MDHMQICVEERSGVPVVRLQGKIIGDAVPEFRSMLRKQIREDIPWLIVDLGEVELLDSTALGVLVGCYTSLHQRGGLIVLTRVPPYMMRVLRSTRLIQVFQVYPDVEAALEMYRRTRRSA